MTNSTSRKVTANLAVTMDGHFCGDGGPSDMGAFVGYATTDVARDQMARMHEGATTALLGRGNAEGFLGYWPTVLDNDEADKRDRGYAQWLVDTEKVVLSTTLTGSPWERTRIVNAPTAEVVTELKSHGTGEILINSCPRVLKATLAADLLDRLHLMVTPEIVGARAGCSTRRCPRPSGASPTTRSAAGRDGADLRPTPLNPAAPRHVRATPSAAASATWKPLRPRSPDARVPGCR